MNMDIQEIVTTTNAFYDHSWTVLLIGGAILSLIITGVTGFVFPFCLQKIQARYNKRELDQLKKEILAEAKKDIENYKKEIIETIEAHTKKLIDEKLDEITKKTYIAEGNICLLQANLQ